MVPPTSSLSAIGALGVTSRGKFGDGGRFGADGIGGLWSSEECLFRGDGDCEAFVGECGCVGVGVGAVVG